MRFVADGQLPNYSIFHLRNMCRQFSLDMSPFATKEEIIAKLQRAIDDFVSQPKPSIARKQTRFSFTPPSDYDTYQQQDIPQMLSSGSLPYMPNDSEVFSPENMRKMMAEGFVPTPANIQALEKKALQKSDSQPRDTAKDSAEPVEQEEKLAVKEGWLEITDSNYGFVRALKYENNENDAFVPAFKIKKAGLRKGDYLKVHAKINDDNKVGAIVTIDEINGYAPEDLPPRPVFEDLTPIFPNEKLHLEMPNERNDLAIRAIDLLSPIGKGQRGMIVSPPKAGKTTLLKKIANSIEVNHPNVKLFVLLIDERPEEVTDMKRSIKGEVIYSTFDELPEHHTRAAEMLLARAKRLVELGEDVVILLDSLTRLARAYNLTIQPTGRTLSGGIDPGALYSPKRFFGAARNIENGGSLTIIATALIDTGSKMDDVIYEEFKGTGNMEIHLDRRLSEKRIFPAIDLWRSGTRREDLLLTPQELEGADILRRMLGDTDTRDAAENIILLMQKTKTNEELIFKIKNEKEMLEKIGFRSFKK